MLVGASSDQAVSPHVVILGGGFGGLQAARALSGWPVRVTTPEAIHIGDEIIPSRTIFWAAGNSASPLGRMLDAPVDRSGRVLVQPDLTVPGYPEVYVIGDLAAFVDQHGTTLPGLAPVAIQQGRAAAENAWRTIRGRERRRFSYRVGIRPERFATAWTLCRRGEGRSRRRA